MMPWRHGLCAFPWHRLYRSLGLGYGILTWVRRSCWDAAGITEEKGKKERPCFSDAGVSGVSLFLLLFAFCVFISERKNKFKNLDTKSLGECYWFY